jgi:thiol-disulfide isomerase/thioredoxin
MSGQQRVRGTGWAIGGLLATWMTFPVDVGAQSVSVEQVLGFRPRQADVEYEIPKPDEVAKCKVTVEQASGKSGWVLAGPQGQTLRRFVDTDGDKKVDQWRYFQHGIEVYRDIDTDRSGRPDEARWVNLGGSRWGVDRDEDGKIDSWKSLSASEASRVAIRAMAEGDVASLEALMVTAEDLKQLGVPTSVATKLFEQTQNLGPKLKAAMAASKVLKSDSRWMRFDGLMPGVVPADDGKSNVDLYVYENATAVIEPGPAIVQLGEMVRVGEVWKLTQVPRPIEGNTQFEAGGLLMQPLLAAVGEDGTAAPSPEIQKLIEELQKLDQTQPQFGNSTKEQLASYNARRVELLMKLHNLADTPKDKLEFLRQCVDGLAAAVETGSYPEGLKRLEQMENSLSRGDAQSLSLGLVKYRRIRAAYSQEMTAPEAEAKAAAQKAYLTALEEFITQFPKAEDVPDAMLNIAIGQEFAGQKKEATEWYVKLAKNFGTTPAGGKAAGAVRRLELKGRPCVVEGPSFSGQPLSTAQLKGRAVLVFFWATWCGPCKEDLPALRQLYQQYQSRGFEIVGVCLDVPVGERVQQVQQLQAFLTQNKVPWPQIFDQGGLDSPVAAKYGVISLPTMFLIDPQGNCVSNSSSVAELKTMVPQLLPRGPQSAKN